MADYVCFENKGEVPVNAFKLLGASSKRGDAGKIGYFGTGLKYAIALMLRKNIDFKVYSGLKEVKIGKRNTKFLDSVVSVMTVNGEKTSITLDAGIDWKPWFAIREIYSNTLDEKGTMSLITELGPKAGHTRIFVDTDAPALKDLFTNWANYFSMNRDPLYRDINGSILDKLPTAPEYTTFRKGIRVFESTKHSLFDYDLQEVTINESRVAVYSFQVYENSSELLAAAPAVCIEKLLGLMQNPRRSEYMEWQNEFWDYTSMHSFSQAWLKALEGKRLVPADYAGHYEITETTQVLPDKLLDKLKKRFGEAINLAGDNRDGYDILPNINKQPLTKILDVFTHAGLDWPLDKIDIVRFHDRDLLGMAHKGRVLLSAQLFTAQYRHRVASTLLEEITHAQTGHADHTRAMQNHLFNVITNMAKELHELKNGVINE